MSGPASSARPLVGLSAGYAEQELGRDYRRHELRAAYLDAVAAGGGLPVVLASIDPALAEAIVARIDALLLTGGRHDIPPAEYGEAPAPGLGPVAPDRTRYERALLAAADRRGLPVLGICGGMQLLVVARGGKLHQHLPADIASDIRHEQAEDRRRPSHRVRVVPGTRLARALGEGEILVNSAHHQGVRVLGRGLVVTAKSPDGLVEGVEEAGPRFVAGVQWHPELLAGTVPAQRALFEQFVAAARGEG